MINLQKILAKIAFPFEVVESHSGVEIKFLVNEKLHHQDRSEIASLQDSQNRINLYLECLL